MRRFVLRNGGAGCCDPFFIMRRNATLSAVLETFSSQTEPLVYRDMEKGAVISPCAQYRYSLWRFWDQSRMHVLFICLNPSKADGRIDDPTLRRCMSFAQAWGFGGVTMANLFAYRATDPKELRRVPDPIGPQNDLWLKRLAHGAKLIAAAWGNHGTFMGRSASVASALPTLHCLKYNSGGEPAHPLYLDKRRKPIVYNSMSS